MNDQIRLVLSMLRALWRKRWIALLAAWSICAVAWSIVLLLPERYEATARVYVDTRTALRPVLKGIAVEDEFDSQVNLVREALLSRPQLEAVARKTNLDNNVSTSAGMDGLVDNLKKNIAVTGSSAGRSDGSQSRDTIYAISYQNPNRDKSIEVVRTLLDNFVEGTLSGNRSGADEAQGFLTRQISDLEKRLADAEARLAEFKKRNVGLIPGDRGDYFARLDAENTGLQQAETNLAVAMSRRAELRRQLSVANPYVPGTSGAPTGNASTSSDVSVRVQEAEARLEDLLLRFTEKHPEVTALKATIADLKAREARELASLSKGGAGTGAIRSLNVNPVYQQIQLQLNQVEVELASLRGAASQHRSEIANLRKFVDLAPEVEQEFARLNRDYGVTKTQYETLVARLEQARVTDDAAQSGIVKFEVIDPPRADSSPIWPNRRLLFTAALLFSLVVALAIGVAQFLISPTFDDTTTLESKTGVTVLGTVSVLRTPEETIGVRLEMRRIAIVAGALIGAWFILLVVGNAGARIIRSFVT